MTEIPRDVKVITYLDPRSTPDPSLSCEPRGRMFGAYRAQWSTIRALARHPECRLTVLTAPQALERLQSRLAGSDVEVHSYLGYKDHRNFQQPSVIYCPGQAFDPQPYALREYLGTDAPITFTHHSLAYPHLLDASNILKRKPYAEGDAIICSSTIGRQVIEWMLSKTAPDWAGRVLECSRAFTPDLGHRVGLRG